MRCSGRAASAPSPATPRAGGARRRAEAARRRMEKLFPVVFNVAHASIPATTAVSSRGSSAPTPSPTRARSTRRDSPITEPLSSGEATLLGALAPLAAATPRGVKRYLNAYRVARVAEARRPALALMLALGQSRDEEAGAAMDALLRRTSSRCCRSAGPPALVAAVRATRAATAGRADDRRPDRRAEVARRYQLPADGAPRLFRRQFRRPSRRRARRSGSRRRAPAARASTAGIPRPSAPSPRAVTTVVKFCVPA